MLSRHFRTHLLAGALAAGLVVSQGASANVQVCTPGDPTQFSLFTHLMWNVDNNSARFMNLDGEALDGHVIDLRRHDDGFKVNLNFPANGYLGLESMEYVVTVRHPEYRVFGAGYIVKEGRRLMNVTTPPTVLDCETFTS